MIQKEIKTQTKIKLVIDLALFIAFLITMDPESSGITIHEWLATAMLAVVAIHLLLNWDWIVQVPPSMPPRCPSKVLSLVPKLNNWAG